MFIFNNIYELLCQVTLAAISGVIFLAMALAFRKIIRDVNDILDRVDKVIFTLSAIQQLLIILVLCLNDSVPLFGLFRTLRIIQEVLLLDCFVRLQIENETHLKFSDRCSKLLVVIMLAAWVLICFTQGLNTQYNCSQQVWFILSVINFILSVLQLYIGCQLLYLIHNYWKDQQNQTVFDGLSKITMDELQSRQTQISMFIFSSIISSATMLFWDQQEGTLFIFCVELSDFKHLVIVLMLLMVQYQVSSILVYYIYYLKNKKYFNSHNWEYQKNIANFYDDRSEIPLVDM